MNILLVEDNPADATLLIDLIQGCENPPAMHWVEDGLKAIDYLLRRGNHSQAPRPDTILLDLSLPVMNGYEVLKQIKIDPESTNIPVIILSTSTNPVDENECRELGAHGFVSKPSNLKGYQNLAKKLVSENFSGLNS